MTVEQRYQIQKAYAEGYNASFASYSIANPFDLLSDLGMAWQFGYEAGLLDNRKVL
jgi:hypothetical protein